MTVNQANKLNANDNFAPESFTTRDVKFGDRELLAA